MLLETRTAYKPILYPFALRAFDLHEAIVWNAEEITLAKDVEQWAVALTSSQKEFLTQLFRFFTQADCFHPDTELLTPTGWRNITEITENDVVAQVTEDRVLSFVHPTAIISKDFSGELLGFTDGTSRTDLLVTPTHRLFTTYKGKPCITLAKDTFFYQGVKQHTAASDVIGGEDLTPFERVLIAYQADGCKKEDIDGSRLGYLPVTFAFSKKRKIERLERLLVAAKIPYTKEENKREDGRYTYFRAEFPVESKYYKRYPEKDFSWVDLSKLSQKGARDFIEEVSHWDSHIDDEGRITYSNTRKKAADIVQSVAILAGYTCVFTTYEDPRSEKFSTVYRASMQLTYKPVDGQAIKRSAYKVPYSGLVHCVSVPSGLLVTRYRNQAAITGNCAVAEGYYRKFLPLFAGQPEIAMMMGSFANREGVHVRAYALLIETLGLPDGEFSAFMNYKAMRDKHDYLEDVALDTHEDIYKALAIYAAFTEGMQLFSTFAMLMHFERMGLMPGMTNIVRWSIRDEVRHSENMIALSKVFRAEYLPGVDLEPYVHEVATKMVELENTFIDLAFETVGDDINYGLPAHEKPLTKEDVKQYIRHTADYRIKSLGYTPLFGEPDNPLPWLDQLLMATEHTNFFEAKPTEYSKGQIVEDEGGY